MDNLLTVPLIAALGLIFYQDVKDRLIHVTLPFLVLTAGVIQNYERPGFITDIIWSNVFLLLVMLILTVFFSVKIRQVVNVFRDKMGIGDLFMLMALTPFFSPRNYVAFFTFGMIFSLCLSMVWKRHYKNHKNIPLAGYLSLLMVGLIALRLFTGSDFFTLM